MSCELANFEGIFDKLSLARVYWKSLSKMAYNFATSQAAFLPVKHRRVKQLDRQTAPNYRPTEELNLPRCPWCLRFFGDLARGADPPQRSRDSAAAKMEIRNEKGNKE